MGSAEPHEPSAAELNARGIELAENGEYAAAERWFRRAAETGSPDAWLNLGRLLAILGRFADALAAYGEAGRLGLAAGYLLSGDLLHAELDDVEAAKKAYRKAIEMGDVDAWVNLGVTLESEGDLLEAREAYESAVRLGDRAANWQLAELLVRMGVDCGRRRAGLPRGDRGRRGSRAARARARAARARGVRRGRAAPAQRGRARRRERPRGARRAARGPPAARRGRDDLPRRHGARRRRGRAQPRQPADRATSASRRPRPHIGARSSWARSTPTTTSARCISRSSATTRPRRRCATARPPATRWRRATTPRCCSMPSASTRPRWRSRSRSAEATPRPCRCSPTSARSSRFQA